MNTRTFGAVALAGLLAACAAREEKPAPPPRVERDWLPEIAAEAARADSAVDVVPLPDPAVDDLRRRADEALRANRPAEAEAVLREALALNEGDPALWQSLAESLLAQRRWEEAEAMAARSAELGPRVGALCLRSRYTTFATRIERGDAVGAAQARMQVEDCVEARPTRF
jgi:predicted Zn-dependent protease